MDIAFLIKPQRDAYEYDNQLLTHISKAKSDGLLDLFIWREVHIIKSERR
jgi:hypothetical protein